MGKAVISIPLVTWREGRPRFFASAGHRALGYKGEDLRHGKAGPWFTLEECLAWSKRQVADIEAKRAAIAAGETTAKKTANAAERARRDGLLTVGQVMADFLDLNPRMQGVDIVEGRKKRRALKPNTARYYRTAARTLENFDDGAVWLAPAEELTGAVLGKVLDRIEVAHGLAQTRAVRAAIAAAFKHGRKKRLVAHDPVAALEETLPVLDPRVRYGTIEEMHTLIATADAIGLPEIGDSVMLGLFTAQRQADRLALEDYAITDAGIRFAQGKKHGEPLLIPRAGPLKARLAAAALRRNWKANHAHVVLDERLGRPWLADRYRKAMRIVRHCAAHGDAPRDEDGSLTKDARLFLQNIDVPARLAAVGVKPLASLADFRDQDLRDTAVTWLSLAGCTKFEIASITGHSLKSIDEILKHYFGRHPDLARDAIGKLEAWFGGQG